MTTYDFLNFKSFPSSLKEETRAKKVLIPDVYAAAVKPGSQVTLSIHVKQSNVVGKGINQGSLSIWGRNTGEKIVSPAMLFPEGTFDWMNFKKTITIPSGVTLLYGSLWAGAGTEDTPGISWFDDLKIYQDGVLIYENNFTAPIVQTAVGVVLPIATGLGVVRFGKKG